MHQQNGEGKEALSLSSTRNTSHMATKCQILRSLNLSPLCDTNFVYDFKHDSPFCTQKLTKIQLGQVRKFPQYGNDSHLHQIFFPENRDLSLICKTTDFFVTHTTQCECNQIHDVILTGSKVARTQLNIFVQPTLEAFFSEGGKSTVLPRATNRH